MDFEDSKQEQLNTPRHDQLNVPSVNCRLFSAMGRLKENYISVLGKDINLSIKDFINDEFIKKVKELSAKNNSIEDTSLSNIKSDLDFRTLSEIEKRTIIPNKINTISSYLIMKTR